MATQLPAKQRFSALRDTLSNNAFMARLGEVLPKHLTAERMIRIALHSVNRNPALLNCTQESMMQALMDASQLGLEPSSVLGTAYLVPYGREVKLIAGYQGLIDLARRSGHVLSIESRVVYVGDDFAYAYGTESYITHKPSLIGGYEVNPATGEPIDRQVLAFYAVAHLKEARPQFEIMSKADVDAIRRRSRARDNGPWVTDYAEMGRKTVVRRLAKYLPKSVELAHALEIEDRAEGFGEYIDIPSEVVSDGGSEEPPTATEQLKQRLKPSRQAPADDVQDHAPPMVTEVEMTRLRQWAFDHGVADAYARLTDGYDVMTVAKFQETESTLTDLANEQEGS